MTDRRKIALAVVVALGLSVAFGIRSFRTEVESIRKRQTSGAARCAAKVQEARIAVESAGRLGGDLQGRRPSPLDIAPAAGEHSDPCKAEQAALSAGELMLEARDICGPYYAKAPTLTTNASIARMEGFRRTMGARCREK